MHVLRIYILVLVEVLNIKEKIVINKSDKASLIKNNLHFKHTQEIQEWQITRRFEQTQLLKVLQ
jgi:hypothetical protein